MNDTYRLHCRRTAKLNMALFLIGLPLFFISFKAHGAGFQIPNQSLRAVGIAGAGIAYTPGPDSAYYNPANMSYLEDKLAVEASLTTLALPSVKYTDNRSPLLDGSSDSELFFLPQFHIASRQFNDFNLGFSLTYPYGLTKGVEAAIPRCHSKPIFSPGGRG